jgi:hypothetical protein
LLAIASELVKGRKGSSLEVDFPGDHGRGGMRDADNIFRIRGRESPLFHQLADVGWAQGFLGRVKTPASQIVIVHGPIGTIVCGLFSPHARHQKA